MAVEVSRGPNGCNFKVKLKTKRDLTPSFDFNLKAHFSSAKQELHSLGTSRLLAVFMRTRH